MEKGAKSFKSVAKEAKRRLKSGFWENCKDELSAELARARDAGVSESRACRYFTGKVSCTIRGGGEDDAFYARVKNMLLAEGEVSDAIGRLTDRAYYDTLSYEEKQTVEGKKRKQLVTVSRTYPFSEIKYTKEWLDFK